MICEKPTGAGVAPCLDQARWLAASSNQRPNRPSRRKAGRSDPRLPAISRRGRRVSWVGSSGLEGRRRTRNFTHVRLQGRGRRRYRQCRPRNARDPRRAPLPCLGSGRARLRRLDRPRGLVRRQDAQVPGARALRLFRHRYLSHVGRGDGVEGIFAEDRRAGLHRHRQFFGLADGPGRAADRA